MTRWSIAGIVLSGAPLLLLAAGCGGGPASDYTAAMLATPELDGLVAGELALPEGGAGASEAGSVAGVDPPARRGRLSEEQRAQIRALEGQLDAGSLTPEQFAEQVDMLLGEPPRGGPAAQRIRGRIVSRLELTEQQQTQARDMYAAMRHEVRKLRLAALARARLVLTETQREKLDSLRAERFASLRGARAGAGSRNRREQDSAGRDGGRGPQRPLARVREFAGKVAAALELTQEQRAQMKSIRRELRAAVRARHETAREQFRALLSDEQRQTLEQMRDRLRRWRANRAGAGRRGV